MRTVSEARAGGKALPQPPPCLNGNRKSLIKVRLTAGLLAPGFALWAARGVPGPAGSVHTIAASPPLAVSAPLSTQSSCFCFLSFLSSNSRNCLNQPSAGLCLLFVAFYYGSALAATCDISSKNGDKNCQL